MIDKRYSKKCENCPNWKYMCWIKKPGEIEPQKCEIYTAHKNQTANNWNALGVRS